MNDHCIEWAPFTLREGASEASLTAAADAMQEQFLALQPGFIRRELLKGKGNDYVDIVWWESEDAAKSAMAKVENSSACASYFAHMGLDQAEAGAGVEHFRCLSAYGAPAILRSPGQTRR